MEANKITYIKEQMEGATNLLKRMESRRSRAQTQTVVLSNLTTLDKVEIRVAVSKRHV